MKLSKVTVSAIFLLFTSIILSAQNVNEAQLLILNGEYQKAIDILQKTDKDSNASLLLANAFENIGRYDSSSVYYVKALEKDSLNVSTLKGLARSYSALGFIGKATSSIAEAVRLDSLDVSTRLMYANILKKGNSSEDALEQYKWLVRYDSTNSYYWEIFADCAISINDYISAVIAYSNSLSLNQKNLPLCVKYYKTLIAMQYPKDTIYKLVNQRVENIDSNYVPLLQIKGKLEIDLDKYKMAYSTFSRIENLGDSSFFTLKYLGISLFHNDYYYQADDVLSKAYAMDSSDAFMNFVYAKAMLQIGDRQKAIGVADNVLHSFDQNYALLALIYELKGDIYFGNQDYKKAEENYLTMLKYSSDDESTLYKMCGFYYQQKDVYKTKDFAEKYLKLVDEKYAQDTAKLRELQSRANFFLNKSKVEIFFLDKLPETH